MKKEYTTPTLEVDSFQLDADTATGDCAWITVDGGVASCEVDFDTPGTNDGKCYHSYVESGVFVS